VWLSVSYIVYLEAEVKGIGGDVYISYSMVIPSSVLAFSVKNEKVGQKGAPLSLPRVYS
jgi:hypothetical protein